MEGEGGRRVQPSAGGAVLLLRRPPADGASPPGPGRVRLFLRLGAGVRGAGGAAGVGHRQARSGWRWETKLTGVAHPAVTGVAHLTVREAAGSNCQSGIRHLFGSKTFFQKSLSHQKKFYYFIVLNKICL